MRQLQRRSWIQPRAWEPRILAGRSRTWSWRRTTSPEQTSIIELEPCKKCDNEEHSKETCPTAQALAAAQAAAHNTYYKVISWDPTLTQNRGVDNQSFQE